MARISIIGVIHSDPYGRTKVHNVLAYLVGQGFTPECIAVEWKAEDAQKVIAQRERFAFDVKSICPGSLEDDIEQLADGLAFEADSHVSLLPHLPIIWLDEQRNSAPDEVESFSKYRVSVFRHILLERGVDLMAISAYVLRLRNPVVPTERDSLFVDAITRAVKTGYTDFACVVGVNHMNGAVDGVFGSQLCRAGHEVRCFDTTLSSLGVVERMQDGREVPIA